MAGNQSWAETRWWHGTVFAWPAVLLGVAFAFGFAAVALPSLLVRHTMSRGLHDFYLTVYRSTCASSERRTAALPYVTQMNGTRKLATTGDVVVLPPTPNGSLRLTLSPAAINGGAKGLQFVRVPAWRTDPACADLSRQIQANAPANGQGIPWWMQVALAGIPAALALAYTRHRRAANRMRRGQTLRGPELLSAERFNRLKRGDGVGFATRDTVSLPSLLLGRSGREVLRVGRHGESSHFLLMGDTGTGKSSLIRQLLEQIADRDEAAIVYDPALEFTPQFYRPERGDRILNPLGACPSNRL